MNHKQKVRCPNCGSYAERCYFTSNESTYSFCPSNYVIQTQCSSCDYLMVMCSRNGSVIEAHAPGTSMSNNDKKFNHLIPIS
ncbi:MAG: replication restart DNA helicase PriA [Moorea sp. SIO2B7]|nr:replication restart DNA helicase PriA [Moorena sp. SIO2B7]